MVAAWGVSAFGPQRARACGRRHRCLTVDWANSRPIPRLHLRKAPGKRRNNDPDIAAPQRRRVASYLCMLADFPGAAHQISPACNPPLHRTGRIEIKYGEMGK
jgi:hypothetical protein